MPTIPQLLQDLAPWIYEEDRCTVHDLEFYEEFNAGYRPSNWTGNPATDEEFLTFAQDGVGGQYTLWLGARSLDESPVVKLGRDGELLVLARDPLDFAWLIASGVEPIGVGDDGVREVAEPTPAMQEWVRSQAPGRTFVDPAATLRAAHEAYPELVARVRAFTST